MKRKGYDHDDCRAYVARACESGWQAPPRVRIKVTDEYTPDLNTVIYYASRNNIQDLDWVRWWYDVMETDYCWSSRNGELLQHWGWYMKAMYRANDGKKVLLPKPTAKYTSGKPALCSPRRQADNLLPSTDEQKEELRELFG